MKLFPKIFGIIVTIITIYIAFMASLFVVPRIFGYMPYIVLSGSMEPLIPTGSIAYIDQKNRNPKVNDVITFRLGEEASIETGNGFFTEAEGGTLVTHRLMEILDDGRLITKGDANDVEDMVAIYPSQVVGVYKCNMPRIGIIVSKLGKKTLLMIFLGIVVLNLTVVLISWGFSEKDEEEENNDSNNEIHTNDAECNENVETDNKTITETTETETHSHAENLQE